MSNEHNQLAEQLNNRITTATLHAEEVTGTALDIAAVYPVGDIESSMARANAIVTIIAGVDTDALVWETQHRDEALVKEFMSLYDSLVDEIPIANQVMQTAANHNLNELQNVIAIAAEQ